MCTHMRAGGIGTFQFIYFFSSFWGQFGPNCTTFLLAGDRLPVSAGCMHAMHAGIFSACLKLQPAGHWHLVDCLQYLAQVVSTCSRCTRCKHLLRACNVAGELYPTSVRTTAHGMSAGTAKCGALWAVVWFNYLGKRAQFWTTASFNFGGMLLTALFMPDPVQHRPPACVHPDTRISHHPLRTVAG